MGGILMKNLKINEKFKAKILLGGLSIVLITSGIGCNNKKNISPDTTNNSMVQEALSDYIEERDNLKKEIKSLKEEKKSLETEIAELENSETFDIENLIVLENSNINDQSHLYILDNPTMNSFGIYEEYCDTFQAFYNLHEYDVENHVHGFCPQYVHFYDNEAKPLFEYLNDQEIKEIGKLGGQVTTQYLKGIEKRINQEYQQKMNNTKKKNK